MRLDQRQADLPLVGVDLDDANLDALAECRRQIAIPIVTGEELYTRAEFRRAFEVRAADIVNPDVCNCGGILELRARTGGNRADDAAFFGVELARAGLDLETIGTRFGEIRASIPRPGLPAGITLEPATLERLVLESHAFAAPTPRARTRR